MHMRALHTHVRWVKFILLVDIDIDIVERWSDAAAYTHSTHIHIHTTFI